MILFGAQLLSTLALVGLIWTVQLVHYPLLAEVRVDFARYHAQHCARIAWLVGPLMATELVTAALLVHRPPPGVPGVATWIGLALVLLVWAATARLSMPAHARLGRGYDAEALRSLVATNWVRTLLWTARGLLVLWMGARWLEADGPRP